MGEYHFRKLEKLGRRIKRRFIAKNLVQYTKTLIDLKRGPLIIAFIGMDGAGKSTVSDACLSILENSGIQTKKIYLGRGKQNIIPLQKPAAVAKSTAAKFPNPVKKSIYSLGAIVYAADFIVRSARIKRAEQKVVISDRFASDILLMPNVPRILRRILHLFLIKADKYIYIYNDVDVLAKRKAHNIDDLKRQEREFLWVNKILNPTKIRNNKISETVEKSIRTILFFD